MKRLKSDISHRIRRRRGLLQATWVRAALMGAIAVTIGLLAGPPLAAWLTAPPRVVTPVPAPVEPVRDSAETAAPRLAETSVTVTPATSVAPPAPPTVVPAARPRSTAAVAPRAPAEEASRPPAPAGDRLYRVQLGSFREGRNATQLVARLQGAGIPDASITEQGRARFRVVVPLASATEVHDEKMTEAELVARLTGLGLSPAPGSDGYTVAGPLARDLADEVVERLRGEGLPGRVQDDPAGGTLRIVRVGAYRSLDEAERARADLAGRGFPDGAVVRER
jgi:cell division septation protein DedD